MVRVSCNASNVLEFSVSRRFISSDWSVALETLEESKGRLKEQEVLDPLAKEFLSTSSMDYYDSLKLRDLLQHGEDGKSRRLWIGPFTSPAVNGCIEVVRAYEAQNLFLAEHARDLRRIMKESAAIFKAVTEKGHMIARVEEKLESNASTVAAWQRSLDELVAKYGIACDGSDARLRISEYFESDKRDAQSRIDAFVTSGALAQIVNMHSPHDLRLAMEEEYFYLKTVDSDAPKVKELQDAIADIIRVQLIDVNGDADRVLTEIQKLRIKIDSDGESVRLKEIIAKCRAEIAEINANLQELQRGKQQMVERIRKDFSLIAPHVDIVI